MFGAEGGALESCGVRVELAPGAVATATQLTLEPATPPSATLPPDRALEAGVVRISASPPLPAGALAAVSVVHDPDPLVRGLARLTPGAPAWDKVAIAWAADRPLRASVRELGHFAAIRDTREQPLNQNNQRGIGAVLAFEAEFAGQPFACTADDFSYAQATLTPDGGWYVTAACERFVSGSGSDWALRVDYQLDAALTPVELVQVRIFVDGESWQYVSLAQWQPRPAQFVATPLDGRLAGETDVDVWIGPENGQPVTLRWEVVTEGFVFGGR
jgi:hypothetical protein